LLVSQKEDDDHHGPLALCASLISRCTRTSSVSLLRRLLSRSTGSGNASGPGRAILYLASPYGFSPHWRTRLLPDFVTALEALGCEVWEPFARNGQVDLAQPGWAWRVAQADLQDVRDADALLAIVIGTPPDEGVMLELGAAIGLGKPVFLYRDDFRRCSDSEDYPLNLMVFSGLPQHGWRDWLYGSIAELSDPTKALLRWLHARGGEP
jgi:nucleoside 2-deoxyribosyltransferase